MEIMFVHVPFLVFDCDHEVLESQDSVITKITVCITVHINAHLPDLDRLPLWIWHMHPWQLPSDVEYMFF